MIDDTLREELSALLDGALPEERAKELRRRIAAEPELAREYEALGRAVSAVRALPRGRAPGGLRARLRASIGAAPRARIFRLGALAAAATVVLAAGLAFHLLREEPPGTLEARKDAADGPVPADRIEAPVERDAVPAAQASKLEAKADGASSEKQALGAARQGARGTAKKAEEKQKEEESLLAAVARSRKIAPEDRKAYLRRVSALGTEKALEHIRGVFPDESGKDTPGEEGFALATVLLEDRDEALLVRGILDALPRAEAGAKGLAVEQEERNQLTTEILATPDDLERLARWLALLDLGKKEAARPRVEVFGEPKRTQDEAGKPRVAVVRLKYGAPEPKAEAPAEGK